MNGDTIQMIGRQTLQFSIYPQYRQRIGVNQLGEAGPIDLVSKYSHLAGQALPGRRL